MTAPRTVAIFGSCVTRDNFNREFNPDYRTWYSVGAAANQSSVIALMSPPVEPEGTEDDGLDPYDAWNVRSDLSRSFLTEIADAPPDLLVLDFFGDLHFGVARLDDGRYVTDNRWKLHGTAQYARWVAEGRIAERITPLGDPDRYVALWTEALDRFAEHLRRTCPDTTVVVNRGFYAGKVALGPTGRPQRLTAHAKVARLPVRRINALWARLDDHAIDTQGWRSIDLRPERYTSTIDHKWGPFWVHYSADYYHRFLAELHRIDLAGRTDGDVAERIDLVGRAGVERLQVQDAFLRGVLAEQRTRTRALESRGVLRTLRAALRRPREVVR